ncbi:phage major capsid protein [Streptomyces bobili]|uniref:phage major capsid protein n=1 Tax=Streptomyces bobili TaxID=67280 RepID=UPI00381B7028
MNTNSLPRHPRTGVRAVGIVGGRPVWPIKGGAPTLLEQRAEVEAQLADPDFDGDEDELLARAADITAKIKKQVERAEARRALLATNPPEPGNAPEAGGTERPGEQPEQRGGHVPVLDMAERFVKADGLAAFRSKLSGQVRVEAADIDTRALVTTTTYPVTTTRVPGVIREPERTFRVADLLDRQTTTGGAIEYVRELVFTNSAAVVAEGAAKPESSITFDTVSTTTKTVAHWLNITRQAADDDGQLMGYIRGRLTTGLEFKIDAQVLNGNGSGSQLQGIMTATGVQVYAPAAAEEADSNLIRLRKARTLVELSERTPDGVILHPIDWQNVELDTDDTARFRVVSNVQDVAPARIWGMRVISTTAMTQNSFLVGGFREGATLWERQGITILMTDSHASNFTSNILTLLVEARLEVAVHTPRAFVKGTFGDPTP